MTTNSFSSTTAAATTRLTSLDEAPRRRPPCRRDRPEPEFRQGNRLDAPGSTAPRGEAVVADRRRPAGSPRADPPTFVPILATKATTTIYGQRAAARTARRGSKKATAQRFLSTHAAHRRGVRDSAQHRRLPSDEPQASVDALRHAARTASLHEGALRLGRLPPDGGSRTTAIARFAGTTKWNYWTLVELRHRRHHVVHHRAAARSRPTSASPSPPARSLSAPSSIVQDACSTETPSPAIRRSW